jgi:hypothetical protein
MTEMGFQTSTLGMPAFDEWTHLPTSDPASIEIVSLDHEGSTDETDEELFEEKDSLNAMYPFVNMLRGSARYIADHQGETCVFHLPGEMLESEGFNKLMDDIALAWLLGLKIVIVAGCRTDVECSVAVVQGVKTLFVSRTISCCVLLKKKRVMCDSRWSDS